MYRSWWNLSTSPFRNQIDQRWYFESPAHEEALARLLFVVEQHHRCGLLSGAAGTGKSLLLAFLASQIRRSGRQATVIDATGLSGDDLLWQLAAGLQLCPHRTDSRRELWRMIGDHLTGLRFSAVQTVVMVDHFERADEDSRDVLNRLLSCDNGPRSELTVLVVTRAERLSMTPSRIEELAGLRIAVRAFTVNETALYIRNVLSRAGCQHDAFTARAMEAIHECSGGIPRAINRICELALVVGAAEKLEVIDAQTIAAVAEELDPAHQRNCRAILLSDTA